MICSPLKIAGTASRRFRFYIAGVRVAGLLLAVASMMVAVAWPALSRTADYVTLTVVVTDAVSNKPLSQAELTLQFRQPGRLRSKPIAYTAKTDSQGRYVFKMIPSGRVALMVTDPHHQTFGGEFNVNPQNTVLQVKLKPPHPQL